MELNIRHLGLTPTTPHLKEVNNERIFVWTLEPKVCIFKWVYIKTYQRQTSGEWVLDTSFIKVTHTVYL